MSLTFSCSYFVSPSPAIHGDKHQNDRTNSLQSFKTGRSPILIATDVAARGLDIPDVEYVINYSFPLTIEDAVFNEGLAVFDAALAEVVA